jgi:hypothetical protein
MTRSADWRPKPRADYPVWHGELPQRFLLLLIRAFAHTPAKPEPGPTPAPYAMQINECFHTQPVRQISLPDWNSTSRAPGRRPAYQFQCNCIGICTRVWTSRCRTTVLNTSVCMKPTRLRFLFLCTKIFLVQRSKSNWPAAAVMPVRVKNSTTGAGSGSGSGKMPVCVQAPSNMCPAGSGLRWR